MNFVSLCDEIKNKISFFAFNNAISEKVAAVVASCHFISILMDGSQARKTKSEKEMVLIRSERNGIPVYFVASLLEMSEWGGGGAESLKIGIDSFFSDSGSISLK